MNSETKLKAKNDQEIKPGKDPKEKASEKKETIEITHQPGTQEHYLGGDYSSAIIKKIRKSPSMRL